MHQPANHQDEGGRKTITLVNSTLPPMIIDDVLKIKSEIDGTLVKRAQGEAERKLISQITKITLLASPAARSYIYYYPHHL